MVDGCPVDRAGSDAAISSADAEIVGARPRSMVRYSSPEALFTTQNDSLVRALTISCGDPALAEDSVQEAFARLLINWERVSKYDDPATWVRMVENVRRASALVGRSCKVAMDLCGPRARTGAIYMAGGDGKLRR